MPCNRYWIRSSLRPEDIYHYIILDELVPVKAFATKVECLPGKKTKCVRTNFKLCPLHHNHLSLGSKLSFRASVFLLLQLHWKLSRNTWNNVFSILWILVIHGILSSVFWHLVGGEVLKAPHAPGHLVAEPHSERFPPDQSSKYYWSVFKILLTSLQNIIDQSSKYYCHWPAFKVLLLRWEEEVEVICRETDVWVCL